MARTRYKFFETVWNDDLNHHQKGFAIEGLAELFKTENDVLYPIPLKHKYRPDVIANKFYGDPTLYWVLVYANGINDSPEGFYENRVIRIPRYERVLELV